MTLRRDVLRVAPRWVPREYTTLPTRYIPYTVWTLSFDIFSETPFRFVRLLRHGDKVIWELTEGRDRLTTRSTEVTFHPTDWLGSDEVHATFAGTVFLNDEELKEDPRTVVTVHAPEARTGDLITLAEVPRHDLAFDLIAFAHDDTETRRQGRWRVRPGLSTCLPSHLTDLASGRQAGQTRR